MKNYSATSARSPRCLLSLRGKMYIRAFFIVSFLICSIATYAQDNKVTVEGIVMDINNEAIIGASVKEKGTTTTIMTDYIRLATC